MNARPALPRWPGISPALRALRSSLEAKVEAGVPVNALPLSRVIGVAPKTLYKLIHAGDVRALRIGHSRFSIPACEARRLLQIEEAAPGHDPA